MGGIANRKELRHDRHTVSLLTDHFVITPKYRGKILVDEVSFIAEGIIREHARIWASKKSKNKEGNESQEDENKEKIEMNLD